MITQLYSFSIGSFVVAEEWKATFSTLHDYCVAHALAIEDAYDTLAFPDSDLTYVFSSIRRTDTNVSMNQPYISFIVDRNREYYVGSPSNPDVLPPQTPVNIIIREGMEGECRVIFRLPELMTLEAPIRITYKGVVITPKDATADCYVNTGFYNYFNPGLYYVMIHEQNGKAQVKLISAAEA